MKVLMRIKGDPITLHDDGCISFQAGMTIDADGSPHAYHPAGSPPGQDYLANAGWPGKGWGIALDRRGIPFIQGPQDPAPGYFVSTTAYKNPGFRHGDPRRELDSETVPFIVVPSQLIKAVATVVLGCKAIIIDTASGKSIGAMVGDVGPRNHLGEASIAAAMALGVPHNPKRGGSRQKRFQYMLWPGMPASGFRLQSSGGRLAAVAMDGAGDIAYV